MVTSDSATKRIVFASMGDVALLSCIDSRGKVRALRRPAGYRGPAGRFVDKYRVRREYTCSVVPDSSQMQCVRFG